MRLVHDVVGVLPSVKANAKFEYTAVPMPYYPRRQGRAAELDHRRRLAVGDGRQVGRRIQGHREILHLPVGHRPAGLDLHQVSGYLPITKAAYEKVKASGFYEKNPILEVPLKELTNKEPTENSRGLRFGGMVQMRDVWSEEIEAALAGKKSAKEALDTAVSRGNDMLRQFERTAVKQLKQELQGSWLRRDRSHDLGERRLFVLSK